MIKVALHHVIVSHYITCFIPMMSLRNVLCTLSMASISPCANPRASTS